MTTFSRVAVMVVACWSANGYSDETGNPVFPGADWERVAKPESIGHSSAKLEALRVWLKTQQTTALVVSVGGRILFEHGDPKYVSKVASVRKSILAMMYGKYVVSGVIDLGKTVKELGLDDVQKFLPREEHVRLDWLLMSRSGIYLPEGAPDPTDNPPARGSNEAPLGIKGASNISISRVDCSLNAGKITAMVNKAMATPADTPVCYAEMQGNFTFPLPPRRNGGPASVTFHKGFRVYDAKTGNLLATGASR